MRLAIGALRDDLFAWWCERYELRVGRAYNATASARDSLLLRNLQTSTDLPSHQLMLAIDRWLERAHTPVLVFCREFLSEIETLTDPVDEIAVARVYLLAQAKLVERQRNHIAGLSRALMDYDDLDTAWDKSLGDPLSILPRIKTLISQMERDA